MIHIAQKTSLLFLILILLLVGCSQQDTALDPQNPVTITLWHYYVGENLRDLEIAAERFNNTVGLEQGVIVDAHSLGSLYELEQNITASARGEINSPPLPDIFSAYGDKALEIAGYGKLVDLNKYFTDEEQAEYLPSFLADGYVNGDQLLVLPIAKSTELLYLNKTVWENFCTQEDICLKNLATWEGLYQTARHYYQWIDQQTPAIPWDGKGFIGIDALANFIIIAHKQLGVEFLSPRGEVILNKKALSRIFDLYYSGYSLGYFDSVGRFGSDDVKTGDLIAYVGSSAGILYFPTWVVDGHEQKEIDLLVRPYPVFKDGGKYALQQGAGMCVVKSNPAHEEAAVLFLKWFTNTDNNIDFAGLTGYVPVKQDAYTAEDFLKHLEEYKVGDKVQRNVAATYDIILEQILERDIYAVAPFPNSYEARRLFQDSLLDISQLGRERALSLQKKGLNEEELLLGIEVEESFIQWLHLLEKGLIDIGVSFQWQ